MKKENFENIASKNEISKGEKEVLEFYDLILDPEERPWLVTDEASLYDLTLEDEESLVEKIKAHYKINIRKDKLKLPFWQLLDYLGKHRGN